MNAGIVSAILRKDLVAFTRDRFFMLITVLGLVLYPAFFWLLPGTVDETLRLGVAPPPAAALVAPQEAEGAGLAVVPYADEETLAEGVLAGADDVVAGIAFPEDFLAATAAGEPTTVRLLLTAEVPPEIRDSMAALVAEIAYAVAGAPPPVDPTTQVVVLGEDRVGDQVALREQLRPLLAFVVLLVETLALASLVASEVQQRTVTALLVTPATTVDFLAAKGILGTVLAFVEAVVIVALVGGLATQAPLVLLALLLGAALVTGLGMIAGAYGRDFISVLFLSMTFMVPLMIPAFAVLFPGTAAAWVRVLPSYPLVDTIVRVTTAGAGWSEVAPSLLGLAAWCVALFALGVLVLRRRVVRL
jgi:ABC-2 type transport system permease protein